MNNNIPGNNQGKNKYRFGINENIPPITKQYEEKEGAFIPKNVSALKGIPQTLPTKNDIKEEKNNKDNQNQNRKGFSQSKLSNKSKNNLINESKQNIKSNSVINKNFEEDDLDKLVIGLNEKKQQMYIPESSRFLNTLVLGNKGTGKTTGVLPLLLEQDLKNKNHGCTVIVSKNEIAYNLYALAKQYKRDAIILKPSVNNEICNKFLWRKDYNYDYINEHIINYKEAIKKKQIVIIDMEILKHKSDGLKAVAMLLLQLQLDIQETDVTQKKPHFLYIDDGQYYLPFLEYLFSFGDNYNLGITLFLQSRNQLIKNGKNYAGMIDNNIRNILLLNSLDKDDVDYYKERLYEYKSLNKFYNRKTTEILYETVNFENTRKCGEANYNELKTIDWTLINNKAKSIRSKLLKQKRKELERELLLSIKNKYNSNDNEYYEEEETYKMNTEESENISEIEKELINSLPLEEFDDDYEEICEPVPIDLKIIDEHIPEKSGNAQEDSIDKETIENHVEVLKKDNTKVDKKEKNQFKEEKIKEIIKIREKSTKRTVSTKIFNNLVSDIDYCDDNFDFSFD